MSGFGARIDFRRPLQLPASARRMAHWLERRARDGGSQWTEGPAALVHAAYHTVPEDVNVVQPFASRDGHLRIVAFARIDNRSELLAALGSAELGEGASAHLILAAYQRWGPECVRHLIGDFAFAIWDRRAQHLFCARDPLGLRTLYYSADDNGIVVGSEVGVVLAGLERRPPHHRAMIEDQLANRWERYLHETAYEGLYRLPPAHRLQFSHSRVELDRYWVPRVEPPRRQDEREYVQEFRSRFTTAVRDRLPAVGPVGVSVSGGMDSSSVACVSHDLMSRAAAPPAKVRLYSSVFRDTRYADEHEYFDAVAARCSQFEAVRVVSDDLWALREFGGDRGYPMDEPEVSKNRAFSVGVARAAAADGCRVLLGGFAGDQVLCGDAYPLPNLLQDVPLSRVLHELPHFHRRSGRPGWWILATAFGLPHLPKRLQTALSAKLRQAAGAQYGLPLRAPSTAPPALPSAQEQPSLPTRAAADIYGQLTNGLFQAEMGDLNVSALEAGVEWRFPFLDVRFVELMLSLPGGALFRDGVMKLPLRQALGDLLPAEVRTRTTNAHFSELGRRGLRERERSRRLALLDEPRLVSQGYVEAARLRAAWDLWEQNPARYCARPLFGSLLIEAWLRSQEEETGLGLVKE
jgi:asparagine synthase (glutamine-hydrolysing)